MSYYAHIASENKLAKSRFGNYAPYRQSSSYILKISEIKKKNFIMKGLPAVMLLITMNVLTCHLQ